MLNVRKVGFVLAVLVAMPLAARADSYSYGFEDLAATGGGAYTSLTVSLPGLSFTITRVGASEPEFDIFQNVADMPASWQTRSLRPFDFNNPTGGPFNINFSSALTSFSVDIGDFQPSDFDTLSVAAYTGSNATGSLVASDSDTLPSNPNVEFDFRTLTVSSATPFSSIRMVGGSTSFPNSTYYDNLQMETAPVVGVPEPTSLALLGVGALSACGYGLRRRKQAV